MSRLSRFFCASLFALTVTATHAAGIDSLSTNEAGSGVREALAKGADFAVASLGKPDGFMGNKNVRIPLPDSLKKAEKAMRTFGMGKQADELVETMNRAAESAVAEAKPILSDAIKKMTIQDAKAILTGGEDSVTQYFRRTSADPLTAKFMPIVKEATRKVKLAESYNSFAGKAADYGLISKKDADLDAYVTDKAMEGLFKIIAEQEKSLRSNPLGAGSDLLKKVFSAL